MSDELKKSLPRIRTFAQDFEHDRQESGLPLPPGVTVPQQTAPTLAAAPTPAAIVEIADATKKAPTVAVKAHVPAFHELKKSPEPTLPHAGPQTLRPKQTLPTAPEVTAKTVVVRTTKPLTPQKTIANTSATIITDTKRNKQKLIPAIISSFRKWLQELSDASKQKHTPKYTVADTERRKGVIQKATTKTGTIFTSDNETLKEEIRRRNWEQPTLQSHDPDISWSPNTEVGYPLLESGLPTPAKVTVTFKKQTTSEPVPFVQSVPTPPQIAVQPVAVPPPVFVEPSIPESVVVEPAPLPVPTPVIAPPAAAPISVPDEPEQPYQLTTPEAHYRIRSIGDVTKLNTNLLSIGVVSTIAAIVIVIIVARALVGMILEQTTSVTTAPATPIAIQNSMSDIALDTPTQEALIIALQQIPVTDQTKQEFRITDKSGTPLSKQVVLPLLGFSNTGSLNQTITDIHIVQIGTTRGIIFSVTDPTTAFGSLLSWEGYMVDALGPILGTSRPGETLTVFDRTIQNTDIRIFTAGNQEVLVYGFLSANKVLITKDVPSFTKALGSQ